jgi:hypothetical protein
MGMLMLAHGVSSEKAFAMLARRSQQTNVKLRDLAGQFVKEAAAAGGAANVDDILATVHERVGSQSGQ